MARMTLIPSDDRVSGASGAWLLAARLCLAAVFLYSGTTKLVFWSGGIDHAGGVRDAVRDR